MPHIAVNNELAGIRGLLNFRPETAEPLGELANILLKDTEGLTPAERELIATHVSYLNDCFYCHNSHGAIACIYLDGDMQTVDAVRKDPQSAPVSDKLKALLAIAGKVQKSGKSVEARDIERAREAGATDRDIQDTVLIAAAFCMFNRYVDGLAANTPTDLTTYEQRARQVAARGYGKHIYTTKTNV
ncbi:MAG TPA: peroxidase-related enzyme [Puia sp.]|uniref:carboxymuconolactone decarboxylase family protein n=1 Tax=Puia sp. TaxID=2045100 RepID=UPI002C5A5131|nr:peroxidase-related enzyme [Puia sp.]HVU94090.1 peroxidase-related enzyme [Puia sp.]